MRAKVHKGAGRLNYDLGSFGSPSRFEPATIRLTGETDRDVAAPRPTKDSMYEVTIRTVGLRYV
jgi:hypothetical protein